MRNLPIVDLDHFRRFGYVLVKNVFPESEILTIRSRTQSLKQREVAAKNYVLDPLHPTLTLILGDVLSKPELKDLDYVLFDDRVLACARQILGQELVYFGDSSIQTGEGPRGFHKDNVDRFDISALDWKGEYGLIRFGIYLQNHESHSGGLKIRLKSHNLAGQHRGKAVNVPSESGDIVIWSLRTTHSGNNVRLRGIPQLCLHPRLESALPRFLRVPEQCERLSIFGTYAAPGSHLDRYLEYIAKREDYVPHLLRAGFNKDVIESVRSKGIQIREPIEKYGSLSPDYVNA